MLTSFPMTLFSGGAPPLPPLPANINASYIANPLYAFKDAAMLQPCGDGDLIYTLVDRVNGYNATQPTAANRPSLRRTTTGKWGILFDGVTQYMTMPSGVTVSTQNSTMWAASLPIDGDGYKFSVTLNGSSQLVLLTVNSSYDPFYANFGLAGASTDPTSTVFPMSRGIFTTHGGIAKSTGTELRYNGSSTTGSAFSSETQAGGVIGANSSALDYADNMLLQEVLIYNTALTDIQAASVEAYFNTNALSNFSFPTNIPLIICDGNSITAGVGVTSGGTNYNTYPGQMSKLIPSTTPKILANLGWAAETTNGLIAAEAGGQRVFPYYNSSRSKNIFIGFEGTNDIYNGGAGGVSGATAYADLVSWYTARKAEGWTIICADIIASPGLLTTAGMMLARTQCNASLAEDFGTSTSYANVFGPTAGTTYADAFVQLSALSMTYQGDNTHPDVPGYGLIAAAMTRALYYVNAIPVPANVPALIATTSAGGTSPTTTPSINTIGVSLIVVSVTSLQANPCTGMSDSLGNIYTPRTAQSVSAQEQTQLFDCTNPIVGIAHTFTPVGGMYDTTCVAAFSGGAGAAAFDVQNGAATASGSSLQTGSITPAYPYEIIVASCGSEGQVSSVDSGMILIQNLPIMGGSTFGASLAYKIQSTPAVSINPTFAMTGSTNINAVIAAYKSNQSGFVAPNLNFSKASNSMYIPVVM